jgi:hypothetical protein
MVVGHRSAGPVFTPEKEKEDSNAIGVYKGWKWLNGKVENSKLA